MKGRIIKKTSNEEIFSIPSDHQKELDISIEQMKNGQTISNEMVDHKVQHWLSKKFGQKTLKRI